MAIVEFDAPLVGDGRPDLHPKFPIPFAQNPALRRRKGVVRRKTNRLAGVAIAAARAVEKRTVTPVPPGQAMVHLGRGQGPNREPQRHPGLLLGQVRTRFGGVVHEQLDGLSIRKHRQRLQWVHSDRLAWIRHHSNGPRPSLRNPSGISLEQNTRGVPFENPGAPRVPGITHRGAANDPRAMLDVGDSQPCSRLTQWASPSGPHSFFQMGTVSLMRSMAWRQAAKASARCGELAATTMARSPTARLPMR